MSGSRVLQFPLAAPEPGPEADPGPKIYTERDLREARRAALSEAVRVAYEAIRFCLAEQGIWAPPMRTPLEAVPEPAREAGQ